MLFHKCPVFGSTYTQAKLIGGVEINTEVVEDTGCKLKRRHRTPSSVTEAVLAWTE